MNSIDRETAMRIVRKVEGIVENPYRFITKLVGETSWKLRVGDYRILIDIHHERNLLEIMHVGHRSTVYKR